MFAVAAAKNQALRGDVIFSAVVDEEYAGLGTTAAAERVRADAAVIAEPTGLELIPAHKGFVWLEIETQGVAAHGSLPDVGVDAIAKMGRVLTEIEKLGEQLRVRATHPLLGGASVHASLIRGGQELSSYPERCVVSIERRTLPGETADAVQAELHEILARLAHADSNFRAVVRRGIDRTPLETPQDSAIFGTVRDAASHVLGHPPQVSGVPYWTDAATLAGAGIPTVLFGPTGDGAHAVQEWVDLESIEQCARIYLETVVEFCK
jgi:acetylornithine deacetylase